MGRTVKYNWASQLLCKSARSMEEVEAGIQAAVCSPREDSVGLYASENTSLWNSKLSQVSQDSWCQALWWGEKHRNKRFRRDLAYWRVRTAISTQPMTRPISYNKGNCCQVPGQRTILWPLCRYLCLFPLFFLRITTSIPKSSSLSALIVFKRTMGKVLFGVWVTQSSASRAQKGGNWRNQNCPASPPPVPRVWPIWESFGSQGKLGEFFHVFLMETLWSL